MKLHVPESESSDFFEHSRSNCTAERPIAENSKPRTLDHYTVLRIAQVRKKNTSYNQHYSTAIHTFFYIQWCSVTCLPSMTQREAMEPLLEAPSAQKELLAEVFPLWFPLMCSDVAMLLNEIVGDNAELAAVGLGNLIQNCCALTIGMGLTSALDTFVSQANGAGQYSLCTQYLQRSRVISTVQLLWMIPLMHG